VCRGIMDSMKTFTCLMTLVSVCLSGLVAQTADVPFHRGVNLTGWFQPDQAGRLPFSRFGEQDFRNLSALGVEGIRLPVNFAALVGPGPQYTIDPRALAFLDEAIKQALASGFKLVLDNHSDPLDPRIQHDLEGFLKALWNQLALHYVDWPTGLLYEIQNEPHKIGEGDWARIQEHVLQVLRVQDAGRLVVVTGADWGSLKAMTALCRQESHLHVPFLRSLRFHPPGRGVDGFEGPFRGGLSTQRKKSPGLAGFSPRKLARQVPERLLRRRSCPADGENLRSSGGLCPRKRGADLVWGTGGLQLAKRPGRPGGLVSDGSRPP